MTKNFFQAQSCPYNFRCSAIELSDVVSPVNGIRGFMNEKIFIKPPCQFLPW